MPNRRSAAHRSVRALAAAAALLAAIPAAAAAAHKPLNNLNAQGVLVDGYDVVAYFTDGAPRMGSAEFASTHDGATYWFATQEHKALFDADPARYAPAYGGFCAYAVSRKGLRPIDPAVFHFVGGRLFLQHTRKAYDLFEKDEAGNTVKADRNWPKLVAKKAHKFVPGQFDEPVK
jgi:YHS domain-containing protein